VVEIVAEACASATTFTRLSAGVVTFFLRTFGTEPVVRASPLRTESSVRRVLALGTVTNLSLGVRRSEKQKK
jgi:hypothetical protein